MSIKNKQITLKQIILTAVGVVLIAIGMPNIIAGISVLMTANYSITEVSVILTSTLIAIGFGTGLIVIGSLMIYKTKLLQVLMKK